MPLCRARFAPHTCIIHPPDCSAIIRAPADLFKFNDFLFARGLCKAEEIRAPPRAFALGDNRARFIISIVGEGFLLAAKNN
jgi:hypothetical protein